MGSTLIPQVRRIAIVGAGPAGVSAAKYLVAERYYDRIVLFEQRNSFGGVWNYSSASADGPIITQTNSHVLLEEPNWQHCKDRDTSDPTFPTPMYDGLETNIPDILMKHSDDASLEQHQLFPSREAVLDYLTNYAADIKHLVKFHTQVIHVTQQDQGRGTSWVLESRDLVSGARCNEEYDAVVVASGHYSVPYVPDVKGISEWNTANPGVISHSKFYRNSPPYEGKKTIVVGYSASGIEIAFQISQKAKLPILVSQRSATALTMAASYKEDIPEIIEFLPSAIGERAVLLADGRIETGIDAILFCTGYSYSYPFLSSLKPPIVNIGARVEHTYKHIFHVRYPTLAFIGLPSKIIPFRTFEGQAAVTAKVWARRLSLPTTDKMQRWEEAVVEKRGPGRSFHVLNFPQDFDYHNEMVVWASQTGDQKLGKVPPRWTEAEYWVRERIPAIKGAFVQRGEQRHDISRMEELGFTYADEARGKTHGNSG